MIISWILARIRRHIAYRRSLQRLVRLNDHQLADIGLGRPEIASALRGGRLSRRFS